jgi:cbb3-type cytochrome oxidase subunit 3
MGREEAVMGTAVYFLGLSSLGLSQESAHTPAVAGTLEATRDALAAIPDVIGWLFLAVAMAFVVVSSLYVWSALRARRRRRQREAPALRLVPDLWERPEEGADEAEREEKAA